MDELDRPPQLAELTHRIDRLVREHQRLRAERDQFRDQIRDQTRELEELRAKVHDLTRVRDGARKRIDGLIGDLVQIEERS